MGGVQDRTIYEDSVFARMLRDANLMDERDYRTYVDLFSNMSNFMYVGPDLMFDVSDFGCRKKPNVIVHLDVTPDESFERIKQR